MDLGEHAVARADVGGGAEPLVVQAHLGVVVEQVDVLERVPACGRLGIGRRVGRTSPDHIDTVGAGWRAGIGRLK